MAFSRSSTRTGAQIPTSSMADIAFLLLVFFLVTTVFDEERGLPVVLPEAQTTIEVPQTNVLHVFVGADGVVELMRGEGPQVTRVAARQVAALWRSAALANPNLIAAVKTDPAAPYRAMVDVLDGLQRGGAERISLQMMERQGTPLR
jgi:biopolymer transport protein ExbD